MHTTLDERDPWPDELMEQLIKKKVGLVPTLQLWGFELGRAKVPAPTVETLVARTIEQLRTFSKAGGEVLFGTDVGYMTVFDPTEEYVLIQDKAQLAHQLTDGVSFSELQRSSMADGPSCFELIVAFLDRIQDRLLDRRILAARAVTADRPTRNPACAL